MIVSFNIGFTAGICYSRVFYSRVTARLKEKNKKSNFNLLLLNETFLLPPLHIYSYMLLIHLDGHRLYIYSASWPLQNGQLYDWSSFASHLQCTHWAHCFTVSCNGVRAIEILAPQVTWLLQLWILARSTEQNLYSDCVFRGECEDCHEAIASM